ncbi:MAG: cytochrome c oxidase subunit 3 [Chloroflexota bacterium]
MNTLETSATMADEHGSAAAAADVPGHEGHDPADVGRFGLLLFLFSESFLFAAFISARLYLSGLAKPEHVNLSLGVVLTALLVASSLLSYRGLAALRRGDGRAAARWLSGTVLLGLGFVGGVAIEWSTAEFSITSAYGSAFYSVTGLHATHLISGLIALALGIRLLRRNHFAAGSTWGIRGCIIYWTYVDLIWVLVIFPVLYLL